MFNLKSFFKFKKSDNGVEAVHISKDPVCGMKSTDGINFTYQDIKYSFCSDHCRQQFEKNPEAYIIK